MQVFDISERLACRLVGLARSSFRRPLNPDTVDDPDKALRAWLRAYARKHARWGYRRAYVEARNDGWMVNHKKIQRLWGEEGLRVVEYSLTANDLIDQLDVLTIEHGSPKALRMDNGPEFISKALREWANEVDLVFIPPGQPWRNGFIESFNGRVRDDCLRVNQVYSLSYAKGIIGIWKEDYNSARPHSSLGYLAQRVLLKSAPTNNQ